MEKGEREGKVTFWPEQQRIKVKIEAYTCVYFNSEEHKSLHCTKYWIVSSKTENNTKECKVLELHQC